MGRMGRIGLMGHMGIIFKSHKSHPSYTSHSHSYHKHNFIAVFLQPANCALVLILTGNASQWLGQIPGMNGLRLSKYRCIGDSAVIAIAILAAAPKTRRK